MHVIRHSSFVIRHSSFVIMKAFFWRCGFFFALLFPCSFSCPLGFFPDIGAWGAVPAQGLVRLLAEGVLGWEAGSYKSLLMSDTSGFYLNVLNIFWLSLLLSWLWGYWLPASAGADWRDKFRTVARYYLSWQLLNYGWAKIFKTQFYLPEPNTVYSQLGDLPQDLVFWSLMGTARTYTIFGGVLEVLAALLLLSRRLSRAGALLAAVLLGQVVAINFGFNISVKVLSVYLFLLSLLLLACDARAFGHFLLPQYIDYSPPAPIEKPFSLPQISLKIGLALLLLASSLYPFWQSGHWDDDSASRPPLHGVYAVDMQKINGDTLANTDAQRIQRLAIHRRGYFLLQNMQNQWRDFPLLYADTLLKEIAITLPDARRHIYTYTPTSDSTLILRDGSQTLYLRRLPYRKLPFLQSEFDWVIDRY